MRTLFLVAILLSLVVIAFKEPNQSAMQAVNGFIRHMQRVASLDYPEAHSPIIEMKVIAEKATKPSITPLEPPKLSPSLQKNINPDGSNQRQKHKTNSPTQEEKVDPAEVKTVNLEPQNKLIVVENEKIEKLEESLNSKVGLSKLKVVEVKSRLDVFYPREDFSTDTAHVTSRPAQNYSDIRKRYRNTIDILDKIQ